MIETKLTYSGLPVLVTGISAQKPAYLAKPILTQVRVTYENGDTDYVDPERLEKTEHPIEFSLR